jgi:hypothetical protein
MTTNFLLLLLLFKSLSPSCISLSIHLVPVSVLLTRKSLSLSLQFAHKSLCDSRVVLCLNNIFYSTVSQHYLSFGTNTAKTIKLNVASTNGKAHQTKSSLEASCHNMILTILDILNGTATASKDMVDIYCKDFMKDRFCHLHMSYDDSILIQSTVASYDSSSPLMGSSIMEVDVLFAYDKPSPADMEAITQEALITLATDGLQNTFALEPEADVS